MVAGRTAHHCLVIGVITATTRYTTVYSFISLQTYNYILFDETTTVELQLLLISIITPKRY